MDNLQNDIILIVKKTRGRPKKYVDASDVARQKYLRIKADPIRWQHLKDVKHNNYLSRKRVEIIN